MYREHILSHYRNPHNFGTLVNADTRMKSENPLCGDRVEISLTLGHRKVIEDIRFMGEGCAISQAAASLLTDYVKGKSLRSVATIDEETMVDLLGIPLSATRMKCGMLALVTLKKGIAMNQTPRSRRRSNQTPRDIYRYS
ncbi:MAG: iron-sulfur cluster assembly scaffold protein [Parcubacteria group bacterium]|nr:iron-sulfur cluster assembly scaffold protein [Parcubacteria group bacterium]